MSGNHRSDINRLLAALPGEFKISEVAGDIPVSAWENIVDNDEAFFRDGDRVVRREAFFTGRSFLVTPEEWEIEAGILVPGHRFVPYLDPEVFPSEVVMRRNRRAAAKVEKKFKISQVLGCFQLLGTEQMLDVLAAESPANGFLRSGIQGDTEVELTVFDLADFYRENEFEAGDAIRCEVVDCAAGVVKYAYLSGAKRSAAKKKAFIAALEDACAAALKRFDEELPVPEVLAWSFFLGGDTLTHPEASLDEFVVESLRIILSPGAGEGKELRIATDDADDGDAPPPEVPEGFGISSGETGAFPSMLKSVGSSLTTEEIDGFILDCCATRELDFSHFYSRAFGHAAPAFADEAQEAIFMNAIEERFEELTTHYDRVDDEIKAPLRSSLMEMVEDRLEFLSELAVRDDGAPTADKLRRLALVSGKANELIKLLNREDFMPDTAEAERLEAQVENLLDEQDAAFEELRREC